MCAHLVIGLYFAHKDMIKDMSAKTTADTFFKEVIAAHGVPAAIGAVSGSRVLYPNFLLDS